MVAVRCVWSMEEDTNHLNVQHVCVLVNLIQLFRVGRIGLHTPRCRSRSPRPAGIDARKGGENGILSRTGNLINELIPSVARRGADRLISLTPSHSGRRRMYSRSPYLTGSSVGVSLVLAGLRGFRRGIMNPNRDRGSYSSLTGHTRTFI